MAILRDSAVLKGVGASEGLSFFCNGRGDREVRCNGRGKPLALRKVRGIMRFWKFRAARGITVFSRLNTVCAFSLQLPRKTIIINM